jgi:uncharacterized protein (DUF2235 family)
VNDKKEAKMTQLVLCFDGTNNNITGGGRDVGKIAFRTEMDDDVKKQMFQQNARLASHSVEPSRSS